MGTIATIVSCGPKGRRRVEARPIPMRIEDGDFEWGEVDGEGKVLAPFIKRWKSTMSREEIELLANGKIVVIDEQ